MNYFAFYSSDVFSNTKYVAVINEIIRYGMEGA
jgi:hypothetical protein